MPWFVINTHPKKEFLAAANVQAQGFQVFLPTFLYSYPRIGDRLRPLFPSYLFVNFDPDADRWFPLCHTIGVKRLFSTYPQMKHKKQFDGYIKPTPISAELIESLQQQVIEYPAKQPVTPVIQPGALVKVITGHFEGKEGVCSWSNAKRVALLLDVMNGKLEISFSRDSVEVV